MGAQFNADIRMADAESIQDGGNVTGDMGTGRQKERTKGHFYLALTDCRDKTGQTQISIHRNAHLAFREV